MAQLTVSNFSCLKWAEIELSRMTVIIGPQASGKSIISKLFLFCYDILDRQMSSADELQTIFEFKEDLVEEFKRWFPESAWGDKKFSIKFTASEYSVHIYRASGRTKKARGRVFFEFSELFVKHFEDIREILLKKNRSGKESSSPEIFDYSSVWRAREANRAFFRRALGREYPELQLFIPAGRSFFTSLGKAIAAFEYAGVLDPVTIRFGRLYASLRERHTQSLGAKLRLLGRSAAQLFFGGELISQRNEEFVQADDGRRIPLAMLSSGQQELLPLLIVLERSRMRERVTTYIEEPEAHLFPSAQSELLSILVRKVVQEKELRMMITTHSPYLLTTLNVFLKAGELSKKRSISREKIEQIVPSSLWLRKGWLNAYAIVEGKSMSIIDEGGLIDAEYLDQVSSEIALQFSELLGLEFS